MAEKIITRILDYVLDIKNDLSIGALILLFKCVNLGLISGEQAFSVILMTFTFFLGAKAVASKE